jgi:hypothetical protein
MEATCSSETSVDFQRTNGVIFQKIGLNIDNDREPPNSMKNYNWLQVKIMFRVTTYNYIYIIYPSQMKIKTITKLNYIHLIRR